MKYERYTETNVVLDNMVEIDFIDPVEDGFRKVKETLQRMGIPKFVRDEDGSLIAKTLIQSIHILHKRGRYYICHFKELFALDGRPAELSEDDLSRRNLAIKYLVEWNLIDPITNNWSEPMGSPRVLKVLKHSEKDDWYLDSKYTIGNVDTEYNY